MKSKIVILTATLAGLALFIPSAEAEAGIDPTAIERAMERASLRSSATELATSVKPLDAALAADAKNPALLYARGFAHYAATASLRAAKNKEALIAEFERAIAVLERVKGQPWEAEAAALHSSILGSLIGLKGGLSGMTLSPKAAKLIDRAAKALPGNPRVLMVRGTTLVNTPPAFGGDVAGGAKLLAQAAEIFAATQTAEGKDKGAEPGPRWGRAETLAWLGIARKKMGDSVGARAAWEGALALEPDYGWVKFALLPSLAQK